jgi:hypothetical protein
MAASATSNTVPLHSRSALATSLLSDESETLALYSFRLLVKVPIIASKLVNASIAFCIRSSARLISSALAVCPVGVDTGPVGGGVKVVCGVVGVAVVLMHPLPPQTSPAGQTLHAVSNIHCMDGSVQQTASGA